MTRRRERSEELFQVVVDLAPAERANYLDEHCGSDPDLRADVEKLLQVDARIEDLLKTPELTDAFLEPPAYPESETRPRPWTDSGRLTSDVGHYRVKREIGRGGMGTVYLAEDAQLGRRAAIKLLPGPFAHDPQRLSMFEREARTAANLNHPNIGTVYEFTEVNGSYYLAMEYVEGRVLGELLEGSQPLPTLQFLDIAVQIAEGLTAAHAANVVHRDLKPGNVMITDESRVKILDFGLAKALRERSPAAGDRADEAEPSGVSTVYGTAGYASPEQCAGSEVDLRSDLFSFGVILYELATGTAPFRRDSFAATHAAACQETPDSPRSRNPKLPKSISNLIEKLLQKKPEDRYASCGEVLRLLKRYKRREEWKVYGKRRRRRLAAGFLAAVATPILILLTLGPSQDEVDFLESQVLESLAEGDTLSAAVHFDNYRKHGSPEKVSEYLDQIRVQLDERTAALHAEALELWRRRGRGDAERQLETILNELIGLDEVRTLLALDPDARTAQVERCNEETGDLWEAVENLRGAFERSLADGVASEDELTELVEGIEHLEAMRWNDTEEFPDAVVEAARQTAKLAEVVGAELFLGKSSGEIDRWADLLERVDLPAAGRARAFAVMANRLETARTIEDLEALGQEFTDPAWRSRVLGRSKGLESAEQMLARTVEAFAARSVEQLRGLETSWAATLDADPWLQAEFAKRSVEPDHVPIEALRGWLEDLAEVGESEWPAARESLRELAGAELGERVRADQEKAVHVTRSQLIEGALDRCRRRIREGELDDAINGLGMLAGSLPPDANYDEARRRLADAVALDASFERIDAELRRLEKEFRDLLGALQVQPVPGERFTDLQERLDRLPLDEAIREAADEFEIELRLRGARASLRCGNHGAALAMAPEPEASLLVRGAALLGLDRRDEALPLFRAARVAHTVRARYWVWVGTGDLGDLHAAIARGLDAPSAWRAAADATPAPPPELALEYARRACLGELTEDEILARGGYASFLDDGYRRDFELARNSIRAILEKEREKFLALLNLGELEGTRSQLARLLRWWSERRADLVSLPSDGDPDLLLERAELNLWLGDFAAAGADALAAGDSAPSLLLRAEILVAEGGGLVGAIPESTLEEARRLVGEALAVGVPESDLPRTHHLLARLDCALHEPSARRDLQAAFAMYGDEPPSGLALHLARELMGEFEGGSPQSDGRAQRALDLLPPVPEMVFVRESLLVDLGTDWESLEENRARLLAQVLLQRASANLELDREFESIRDCKSAFDAYRTADVIEGQVNALNVQALALHKQGKHEEARAAREEAQAIREEASEPGGE